MDIIDKIVIGSIVDRVIISATFRIPEKIKQNYKINGDLGNARNWKAKVILANSGGKKGEWDKVGYVMISLNSNYIIPVARADEHQTGHELIWHLKRKKLIPDEKYYSFYSIDHDYFYKSKLQDYLKMYQKALEYGIDPEFEVQDYDSRYSTTIKEFVDNDGKFIDYSKYDKLPPRGKRIIDFFENIANEYKNLISKNIIRDKDIENLFDDVLNGMEVLSKFDLETFAGYQYSKVRDEIIKASGENDYKKLGEILFGFNGVKNSIHTALKDSSDEKIKKRGIDTLFVNRERGIKEFNRLSEI